MGIKSEKTFEEIVERLVSLFKPERRLHRDHQSHHIHSFWQNVDDDDRNRHDDTDVNEDTSTRNRNRVGATGVLPRP